MKPMQPHRGGQGLPLAVLSAMKRGKPANQPHPSQLHRHTQKQASRLIELTKQRRKRRRRVIRQSR